MKKQTRTEQRAATTASDPRWHAIVARDAQADGAFVYSVRTTGVYCRPSCAARSPRPENVAFHASAADARRAGFRACLRCRPDDEASGTRQAEMVADLCRYIESADDEPSLDQLAQRAGLSSSHLHRTFKAATGLTPKAFAQAHRARRMRTALASADTVTEAIYDAGYNSGGRFYAQAD